MSYTSVFEIGADGNCEEVKEYRNSWGSAPYVWNVLSDRYLRKPWFQVMGRDSDALWRLDRDERLRWFERVALVLTFDRVVVPNDAMLEAAHAIQEFMKVYPPSGGVACHWPTIADDLRDAQSRGVRAVCWNHTSVSSTVWRIYNEEEDESRPYNIDTGTEHFLLFDSYPELRQEVVA